MSSRVLKSPLSRSFLLHLFILAMAFLYIRFGPQPKPQPESFTIDVIEPPKTDQKKRAEEPPGKQIVQKSVGEETKEAKKNAYLSDKTRTVKEEVSASSMGEVTGASRNEGKLSARDSRPQKKSTRGKSVTLNDLGLKYTPRGSGEIERDHHWASSQTGETLRGGQYIKGMKEGEVSALNTKEFVFYSYYNRIRKQLEQAWVPILNEQLIRIYKSGRKLASNTDYDTQTLVTMNSRGEVVKVLLLQESGTVFLDQAAIDALNKAGPYPNPPPRFNTFITAGKINRIEMKDTSITRMSNGVPKSSAFR